MASDFTLWLSLYVQLLLQSPRPRRFMHVKETKNFIDAAKGVIWAKCAIHCTTESTFFERAPNDDSEIPKRCCRR